MADKDKGFLAVRAATRVGSLVQNITGFVKDQFQSDISGSQLGAILRDKAAGLDPPLKEWIGFIDSEDGIPRYASSDGFSLTWHSVLLHSTALEALIGNTIVYDPGGEDGSLMELFELCCVCSPKNLLRIRGLNRAEIWVDGLLMLFATIKEDWQSNEYRYRANFLLKEAEHCRTLSCGQTDQEEAYACHNRCVKLLQDVSNVLTVHRECIITTMANRTEYFRILTEKCKSRGYELFRSSDRAKVRLERLGFESRVQTEELEIAMHSKEEDKTRLEVDERISMLEDVQKHLKLRIDEVSEKVATARRERHTITTKVTELGYEYSKIIQQKVQAIAWTHDISANYNLIGANPRTKGTLTEAEVLRSLRDTTISMQKALPEFKDVGSKIQEEVLDYDVEAELIEANLSSLEAACRIMENADAAQLEEMREEMWRSRTGEPPLRARPHQDNVLEKEEIVKIAWQESEEALLSYPWKRPAEWNVWESRREELWYRMARRAAKVEMGTSGAEAGPRPLSSQHQFQQPPSPVYQSQQPPSPQDQSQQPRSPQYRSQQPPSPQDQSQPPSPEFRVSTPDRVLAPAHLPPPHQRYSPPHRASNLSIPPIGPIHEDSEEFEEGSEEAYTDSDSLGDAGGYTEASEVGAGKGKECESMGSLETKETKSPITLMEGEKREKREIKEEMKGKGTCVDQKIEGMEEVKKGTVMKVRKG